MALPLSFSKFSKRFFKRKVLVVLQRNVRTDNSSFQGVAAAEAVKDKTSSWDEEWAKAKPYESIPGPKPLPIPKIGNVWRFTSFGTYGSKDLIKMHKKLMNEFGPIVRMTGIGKQDFVFLYDPELIETMFRHESIWPKREGLDSFVYYREHVRQDIFGDVGGVASTQGKKWHDARSAVNQTMMQPRNARMYTEPIEQVSNVFLDRIRSMRDENKELPDDFDNELKKWALESIATVALDTSLGALEEKLNKDSKAQKFIEAVNEMFDCMYNLDILPSPWKYISTPTWRRYVKALDIVTDTTQFYVKSKLGKIQDEMKNPDYQPNSVLEELLHKNKNPNFAIVMAMDMLTAGVDTTSNAVACAMYYIAKNQDKQEILFSELKRLLPNKTTTVTANILHEMKFLKACIKESMRIAPIAPGNLRTAVKDLIVGGYRIPKDTQLTGVNIILSNLEKYYKQTDKFLPERWLKSEIRTEISAKNTNPFVFLPFGFGPRMCVGRRFAELEMEIILSKIFRNFKVEYNHGEMEWIAKTLYTPAKPLKFKMEERLD